ncbi:MAG: tRNA-uridine aminocarboxypropyltransferase [Pseudomonadota bacterium]
MRPTCSRCQRPLRACVCAWVLPTRNRLPVLVLQHPQEASQAKGSLRLLRLSLACCTVQVGEAFDPGALAGWLGTPGSSLLLYPDAVPAAPRQPAAPTALPCPERLVLLDGTWRQARALLRHNPLLQQLPRWALPAPAPSRYSIRRAQQPGQRSTLEAACAALGLLEDRPAHYLPLLESFSAWVASLQAQAAAGAALSAVRPAAGS